MKMMCKIKNIIYNYCNYDPLNNKKILKIKQNYKIN